MSRNAHFTVRAGAFALVVSLAACQQAAPPNPAPPAKPGAAAATSPAAVVPEPAAAAKLGPMLPALDFPPGPLYVCELGGTRKPIDYEPRVDKVCRRHPEMGPCEYERDACRAAGGRVFTARGEEVTLAVEAEYDRVVRRVRFQADGGKK